MANRVQLQTALQKPYDRILFGKEVLRPVFGSCFTLNSTAVPASVQPNPSEQAVIQSVFIYGTIHLEDGTEITCYEINLQASVRIEQSKVAIQRYVRKLLTAGQMALVNFIAPQNTKVWRLTLVAKDSALTEQGIKEKTTHAKRYTFLLGPSESCKTAAERFETLSTERQITFQTLVNAFSVEKLSKAFFDEYTLHYQKFCDYLQESNFRKSVFNISIPANATNEEQDKACKPIRDFVKKLLGRIVFLYFVQKKGWLGASDTQYKDGLTDFIQQLFKQSGGNDAFYSTWLKVLFFETLNAGEDKRPNEDFIMPNGNKVKVPFLNGGLFDKEKYDEATLTIPATLFHHPDLEEIPLTAKNSNHARGFLDFLDAFNFTVHEDSPDDHTVAVDPEMLGHIFENLLEDNKDKGAFYTPKEIVHYMCQESLTEYLTTHLSKEYTVYKEIGNAQVELLGNESKTGQLKMVEQLGDKALNRDDVAYMVQHKDISRLTQAQLKKIDALLDAVKICDPAIGSGAFPMGLLQEIHAIKEVIAYELHQPWKPAEVKENIIQNSIYGVDIEKGAVDIARLRFWLSLVVDEEKPRALPNLDYKIVVGNSLVSKFEDEIIEIDWEIKEGTQGNLFGNENVLKRQALLKKITIKQQEYFHATDKQKLADEIRNLKIDILINQLELMMNTKGLDNKPSETGKKANAQMELWLQTQGWKNAIAKLQKLKQNNEAPFEHFDWKLDFPEVLNPYLVTDEKLRGFDIVIGNPPYVQLQKAINGKQKLGDLYNAQNYETFERTGDIYCLFYEKGINLLKPNGVLCYITSNKWMRAGYGEKLREYFTTYNPQVLIDLGPNVFESATVDTNILMLQNAANQNKLKAVAIHEAKKDTINLNEFLEQKSVVLNKLGKDAWFIGSAAEQKLKEKIERIGKPLKEWDVNIYRGVLTGLNEAFIITTEKRNEILANCQSEEERKRTEEIIKPILRGRDIKRYYYEWAGLWVIFIPWHFPLHEDITIQGASEKSEKEFQEHYPAVYQHLLQFKEPLSKRNKEETGIRYEWYALQRCAATYYPEFEKEKVVWQRITQEPTFCLVKPDVFVLDSMAFFTGNNLKYIMAILNSKLIYKHVEMIVHQYGTTGFRLSNQYVEVMPIPPITSSNEPIVRQIEALVDNILATKNQNPQANTGSLEKQIDELVYKLYGLTEEEVRIVEGNLK
jgi:type I restriction-modification system DNA methylase subunit